MDGGQSERVLFRTGEPPKPQGSDCEKGDDEETGALEILSRLWARDAAEGLASRTPAYSAKAGLTRDQGASVNLLLAIVILLAAQQVPFNPGLLTSLGAILFSCLIGLRLTACLVPPAWAVRRELPVNALPRASLIIALYRESTVLPVLIAALEAIDYPADRLEIRLALEADDSDTIAAARAMGLDGKYRIVLVPDGGPRTKPRALNYALRFCSGSIIAVHDAEDRPNPHQLRIAAESFAAAGPDLACLQAPLNWFNRGECWLTRQFALEYAAHFHALLPLYARLRWPLPLGGTSNYFRAAALRRAGGWDAWNVTEDADLGFRLHALGYRCDVIAPLTLEEAPTRVWPWICQRSRWLKGYAQTVAVHSRADRSGADKRNRIALTLTLGAALLSALAHVPLLAVCIYGLVSGRIEGVAMLAYIGFLLAGYSAAALTAAVGMQRAGLAWRLADLVSMPFYWPLQGCAALRALYQLVTRPYFWDKTEHGISTVATPASLADAPAPTQKKP